MADISVEKVYSGANEQIYPETSDKAVLVETKMYTGWNLNTYLNNLEEIISGLTGEESLAKSLKFNITYLATDISDLDKIKELEDSDLWGENFQLPTTTSPYIWKKTIVTYAGQENSETKSTPFYEVVTADTAEISQTLYTSKNNDSQPEIIYPQKVATNDEEELVNVDDTDASLDDIVKESNADNKNNWSKAPAEISASNPFGFIAVRTRSNGSWSKFSVALNAKWSYDSKLVIKYAVTTTSDSPEITRSEQNPGASWVDNVTNFTGYLWMATATSSNNNLMADSDKNYWSLPQLISVIK